MKGLDLKKLKLLYVNLVAIAVFLPSFGALAPDLFRGIGGGLYVQDAELFRTWYLTKVTVDNIDYIPSNYGYYPDLTLSEHNGDYGISLADPANITCWTSIENFLTSPNSFMVNQNKWSCFPENTCQDYPNGPCSTIYGNHANIYHGITTPITYIVGHNSDGTFSLEITNTEGNQAYYSSEFLSNQDFILNEFKLYPNPVKEILQVKKASNQLVTATVFDINGKLLQTHSLETSSSIIDVKELNTGLYFVVFKSESGEWVSKKFVKQ